MIGQCWKWIIEIQGEFFIFFIVPALSAGKLLVCSSLSALQWCLGWWRQTFALNYPAWNKVNRPVGIFFTIKSLLTTSFNPSPFTFPHFCYFQLSCVREEWCVSVIISHPLIHFCSALTCWHTSHEWRLQRGGKEEKEDFKHDIFIQPIGWKRLSLRSQ